MNSETKKTILVVDDTKINIDILLELLGDMYHVLVSLSANNAIEILKENQVDIILLDIHMPEMSGYEACRVLKSMQKTKDIPIIFITSNTNEESIDIAFEAGGIDYITKPFKTLELLARIKTHLNTQALINELEVSHREMKLLASQDYMTKLYNRRYFSEVSQAILQLAKRNNETLSLIALDIDNFKKINDKYGHGVGDEVIITLATLLQNSCRESDIACRFGGEEFVVLLPQTSKESALIIAEKLRLKVTSIIMQVGDNEELSFTVSIGIAEVNVQNQDNLHVTLDRADHALYQAKKLGKNNVKLYEPRP